MRPLTTSFGVPTCRMMAHPNAFALKMPFIHLNGVARPLKMALFESFLNRNATVLANAIPCYTVVCKVICVSHTPCHPNGWGRVLPLHLCCVLARPHEADTQGWRHYTKKCLPMTNWSSSGTIRWKGKRRWQSTRVAFGFNVVIIVWWLTKLL